MKNNKRVISLVLMLVLMLSTFSTAFAAADRDLVHNTTNVRKVFPSYLIEEGFLYGLLVKGEIKNYNVDVDGKLYKLEEVQEKFNNNPEITLEDAVKGLDVVEGSPEVPEGDLKVVEVSAINGTFREGNAASGGMVVSAVLKDNQDRAVANANLADVTIVDLNGETLFPITDVTVSAAAADGKFTVTVGKTYLDLLTKGKYNLNIAVEGANKITVPVTVQDAKAAGLDLDVTTGGSIELEDIVGSETVVIALANYNSTGVKVDVEAADIKEVLVNGVKLRADDVTLAQNSVTIKNDYIKLLEDKGVATHTVEIKLEKTSATTTFNVVDSREYTADNPVLEDGSGVSDVSGEIETIVVDTVELGTGNSIDFTDADIAKKLVVKIDGKVLRSNLYTLADGKVTVDSIAYLNTLGVGKHTIELIYDGNAIKIANPEFKLVAGAVVPAKSLVTPKDDIKISAGTIQKVEFTLKDKNGNAVADKAIDFTTSLTGEFSLNSAMPNNVQTTSTIGDLDGKGKTDANGKIAIYFRSNDAAAGAAITVEGKASGKIEVTPAALSNLTSSAVQTATPGTEIELELMDQYGNGIVGLDVAELKSAITLTPGTEVSKFEITKVEEDANGKYKVTVNAEFKVNETKTDVKVNVKGVNLETIKDVVVKA